MKRYLGIAAILVGCGGDPVDAEGTWTVSGTNRTDDCMIGWNVGDTFTNVEVVITQNGEAAIADVNGLGGGLVDNLLGGNGVFNGSVDGNDLDLLREGTKATTTGNCTWTYNAQLLLTVQGDVFTGRLNFRKATNGNSDCAALECTSYEDLNATRPPR